MKQIPKMTININVIPITIIPNTCKAKLNLEIEIESTRPANKAIVQMQGIAIPMISFEWRRDWFFRMHIATRSIWSLFSNMTFNTL